MNQNKEYSDVPYCVLFLLVLLTSFAFADDLEGTAIPYQIVELDKKYNFSSEIRTFDETEAEEFAAVCDEETRKSLLHILADRESDDKYNKGKIAFFIGKTKDTEASSVLISCIEYWLSTNITVEMRIYMWSAITGLGYLGDEKSLTYLNNMAAQEYWDKLPHPLKIETPDSREYLVKWYREISTYAIGGSGTELAAQILSKMEADSRFADIKSNIDSAKENNNKRMSSKKK